MKKGLPVFDWLFSIVVALLVGCQTPSHHSQAGGDPRRAPPIERRYRVVDPPIGDRPPIRFRFPPPVDDYKGEAAKLRGEFLACEQPAKGVPAGWFEVIVTDVTMGEPELDSNIRFNVEALEGKRFATIRYVVEFVDCPAGNPGDRSERTPIVFHGRFEMKGRSVPLVVNGWMDAPQVTPGSAERILSAGWRLGSLKEIFGIVGPGGPDEPAGDRMDFDLRAAVRPME